MTAGCVPACWTPARCPSCGSTVPPRGRSVPLEATPSDCCETYRQSAGNPRHLWSENDDSRAYTDPAWAVSPAGRAALHPADEEEGA